MIVMRRVQYLKTQPAAKITMLLERRVFPLYLMVAPSPYVLANANWMLGELVNCLPEVREAVVKLQFQVSLVVQLQFVFGDFKAGFEAYQSKYLVPFVNGWQECRLLLPVTRTCYML